MCVVHEYVSCVSFLVLVQLCIAYKMCTSVIKFFCVYKISRFLYKGSSNRYFQTMLFDSGFILKLHVSNCVLFIRSVLPNHHWRITYLAKRSNGYWIISREGDVSQPPKSWNLTKFNFSCGVFESRSSESNE